MVVEQQYINAEKFLEMVEQPQYVDCVVELVDGEIIKMSKTSGRHGQITMRLSVKIANHVYANKLGELTAAETGFVLERNAEGRDTIRGLDIAYISATKIPNVLPDKILDVPPDLAVEVISPSNNAADIHLKIMQLLNAGVGLVWIIYPETRTVEEHTSVGSKTLLEDDMLVGGEILPGFEIRVGELFPS